MENMGRRGRGVKSQIENFGSVEITRTKLQSCEAMMIEVIEFTIVFNIFNLSGILLTYG